MRVTWQAGDAELGRLVGAELERLGTPGCRARELRDNPRRRILRVDRLDGPPLLVKQFRLGSGRHRARERLKTWLGRSPAGREWRNLIALRAEGVPVPEPLAFGRLPDGDRVLVTSFCAGALLPSALEAGPRERRRALVAVARAVAALHAAGYVHRDLHAGNLLVEGDTATLLDLQSAGRSLAPGARFRDLGWLDDSLVPLVAIGDRMRLRRAALALLDPRDPEAREELRAVGRASRRRALEHARSRTRRSMREGRAYTGVRSGPWSGLRLRELHEGALEQALAAHRAALASDDERVLKHDDRSRISAVEVGGRRLVVKEFPARGWRRALADRWRGSPARRGWRAGHGLAFRRIGAARPHAFLERHRLGLPSTSLLVLGDVRPAVDALVGLEREPARVAQALGALLARLHRYGVDHADLKCEHVFLDAQGRTRLVDLEGVRFRRRLPEAARLRALVVLNASLPDTLVPALRRRAFARYVIEHPFRASAELTLRRITAQSLARKHRFRGVDCDRASTLSPSRP